MDITITPELKRDYLAASHLCPLCQSNDLEPLDKTHDGERIRQGVECRACGAQWVDVFTLNEIEDLIQP